jgi:hypothetical protein
MGEFAMHQSLGLERFDPLFEVYLSDEEEFQRLGEELDNLADVVSEYAANNHAEFVAEVFAALQLGRAELKDNPRVMELYERFGGAEISSTER